RHPVQQRRQAGTDRGGARRPPRAVARRQDHRRIAATAGTRLGSGRGHNPGAARRRNAAVTAPPDDFYARLPLFRNFTAVMDPRLFSPLPGDWVVGTADVVQSTKAIAENRYKAVNMAGAAVIVAVTNALDERDFPFVFGGDGASFAVPPEAAAAARQALAETAT